MVILVLVVAVHGGVFDHVVCVLCGGDLYVCVRGEYVRVAGGDVECMMCVPWICNP